MHDGYLSPTPLLDFESPSLQQLVARRGWRALALHARIGAVYAFVRDEVPFGYNVQDALPASRVLADGLGQCNTKTILLMALLRAVGVPCRFHGATIHKRLQRGVVRGMLYALAPTHILHSWAEVWSEGRWVGLEGVILDAAYLEGVRTRVPAARCGGAFLGYGVGTECLEAPPVVWRGEDTFIQATGVDADLGVFDDPDGFYAVHHGNLRGVRAWLFRRWVRGVMNSNVARIRGETVTQASLRGPVVLG